MKEPKFKAGDTAYTPNFLSSGKAIELRVLECFPDLSGGFRYRCKMQGKMVSLFKEVELHETKKSAVKS